VSAYRALADVYEFLTPEALLTPAGSFAAFAGVIEGPRVLDCACGIGLLAAGLIERGFEVEASDASPEMIRRTAAYGVPARVCRWEDLRPSGDFDTVLCVGNSLPHARDRLAALRGMAGAMKPGARLVLTSRNWDLEQHDERYEVERGGRRALVTYTWAGSEVDVTVSVGGETVAERLTFWPFTHETLLADLRGAGLGLEQTTWEPEAARYLVTARTSLKVRG
jgi:SAM-dependent methyltransferase